MLCLQPSIAIIHSAILPLHAASACDGTLRDRNNIIFEKQERRMAGSFTFADSFFFLFFGIVVTKDALPRLWDDRR